ncbi:MAG: elongation factor P [Candidatus Marinimicrobia bacterium]|jgi:elongation factor P|nr:elongation factor P [Candidatus Neomarinimicrobiota bacterium]|tara:strand:+ start:138 stop:698 length:561 start_codon:yes stop_codon:yes gene_type:complete
MASTSDFKNGLILRMKNNLLKIVEFQHVKPGKGAAFVRTKLKNIKTGQVIDNTFRSGEKVEVVRVESHSYNFSYSDGDDYYFMDNETYEQISIQKNQLSDIIDFLIENTSVDILFDGDIPLEVRIPQHMNFVIVKTEQGEKGNTATGATKPAELETGLIIQVPLFIKEGEKIRIDTKEKKYIERTK